MEKSNYSAKYLKQRKFFLVLPLLTLPFITLLFWALGGGKGNATAQNIPAQKGLNFKLPDAKLKDEKGFNKLSFYQQAALDSAKAREAKKLDPYWNKIFDDSVSSGDVDATSYFGEIDNHAFSDSRMDANKTKVYNKLDELRKALNKSREASYNKQSGTLSPTHHSSSKEVERLQAMMQRMKQDKPEDPEITQLNEMLDKIMAIQNPEKVKGKNINVQSAEKNLSVKRTKQKADISLLKSSEAKKGIADTSIGTGTNNSFYSETDNESNDFNNGNSIEAIIPETQTLVAGATIKLSLSNDVTIKDILIPTGTFIYGTASLSNERLKIAVSSIRIGNTILPVSLDVYDLDGQEGIYIPGSINRTVAKESTNNAIGRVNTTTVDPSIEAQAASAGIEAAKSLLTKKVKLIKMTVTGGYKVLLIEKHQK